MDSHGCTVNALPAWTRHDFIGSNWSMKRSKSLSNGRFGVEFMLCSLQLPTDPKTKLGMTRLVKSVPLQIHMQHGATTIGR